MDYRIKRYYLDTCAWCRPFDEPRGRIIDETNAILQILAKASKGEIEIVASTAILAEIDLISDKDKKYAVKDLINKSCKDILWVKDDDIKLAEEISKSCQINNIVDAIHIAVASKNADIFITVDDELIKKSHCLKKYIDVKNPLDIV